ncbi:hypothetical protein [Paraoerskovia marina]|uniref:hypothetical protein n=1 Tax=Paraoerskovia marina TaxID=545619 RepID=UPI0004928903|nr:hypothetical protein [Paraoerskovia marina]
MTTTENTPQITTAPTLGGRTLRIGAALLTAATLLVGLAPTHLPTALVSATVAGAALLWRPTLPLPWMTLALVALPLLGDDGFTPYALALAPLGHLTVRATWWARHTTTTTRVETRALRTEIRPAATILATTLTIGTLAAWATTALAAQIAVPLGAVLLLATVLLAAPARWWR